MADATQTLAAVQDDISRNGKSCLPFKTVEHMLDTSVDDDDQDFIDDIDAWISATEWVSSRHIDWINREVLFEGPFTEPGGP